MGSRWFLGYFRITEVLGFYEKNYVDIRCTIACSYFRIFGMWWWRWYRLSLNSIVENMRATVRCVTEGIKLKITINEVEAKFSEHEKNFKDTLTKSCSDEGIKILGAQTACFLDACKAIPKNTDKANFAQAYGEKMIEKNLSRGMLIKSVKRLLLPYNSKLLLSQTPNAIYISLMVSGVSDILSIPLLIKKRAKLISSLGPWPQMPMYFCRFLQALMASSSMISIASSLSLNWPATTCESRSIPRVSWVRSF